MIPEAVASGVHELRAGCGARVLERDVLSVAGPEAETFLQGQVSQDVAALAVGGATDAFVLSPEGRLVALVRITRRAADAFVLDVARGFGDVLAARLARFKLRTKVDVAPLDWAVVALRGRGGAGALGGLVDGHGGGDRLVVPVEWGGTTGVDVLGPDAAAALSVPVAWCSAEAWDALRVEAGIPEMGTDLDTRTIPAETGLLERAVSFTKGCYTGQELVARMDARGNRAPRRLVGIVPAGEVERWNPSVLAGAELVVSSGGKTVGRCTSAAWCPGLGGVAGLGMVQRSVAVPGPVGVVGAGAGGVALAAEVREVPLVPG